MTILRRLMILGAFGVLAALTIGGAQAANPNRLPDIGDAERIIVPGDGVELAAYLFRPEPANGLRPAIVFLHGSENNPWESRNLSRFLRDQGYVVLAPSQRGASGSDFGTSLACEVKADDTIELIKWLGQQPGVDAARIGVWGRSRGASVALLTAARTGVVRAVVASSGPSDLNRYAEEKPNLRSLITLGCGGSGMDRNSPINFASDIKAAVLLVHGELDELVSADQSRDMFEALIRAGGEAELIVMPGEGHRMSNAAWTELWPRILAHFEEAFRAAR